MKAPKPTVRLSALFALTLLLSAALLFLVQPMFGKIVLPRFGGAPAVWNTCLVFFQAALLAGYAYAHVLSTRLSVRWQVLLHAAVLLLPFVSLPIAAAQWEMPGDANPIPWLLGLLAVSVGLPFVVVAATAPLLQGWFARTGHPAAIDPYSLYAASNVGSLLALVAYPLVLEPTLPLRAHSLIWTSGYGVLVVLVLTCGVSLWWLVRSQAPSVGRVPPNRSLDSPLPPPLTGSSSPSAVVTSPSAGITALARLRWAALALAPCSLMLSVTSYLTTDVAAVPLLWVIPLALYLVTFVLAFARPQLLPLAPMARVMPLVVLVLTIALVSEATHPVWLLMVIHLASFFVVALVGHGELARSRPPADRLTEFYLWLSLGGILGGMFNALVAPHLFRSVAEYPLALVLACLLRPAPPRSASVRHPDSVDSVSALRSPLRMPPAYLDLLLPLGLALLAVALVAACERAALAGTAGLAVGFGLPAVICYLFLVRPVRFALGIGALLLAASFRTGVHGDVLHAERSFFGVHRITLDPSRQFIRLVHGNTVHGKQQLASGEPATRSRPEPLTYYHRSGPIGQTFALPRLSAARPPVAVVGLGAGSLAAYAAPGQQLDFYEIDPVVRRIAEEGRYFTFLKECQGRYRIILGDARLRLARAEDRHYGLIVVDAFGSDAIPLHLITREALLLYVEKLSVDGLIAFNISNRYLDLAPVLADLAGDLDLACLIRNDLRLTENERQQGKEPSIWVVLARQRDDLAPLADSHLWAHLSARPGTPVWTDDYANIVSVIKWK